MENIYVILPKGKYKPRMENKKPKVVFLGCGYLGYNLAELFSQYYDTSILGIDSPYSEKSKCFIKVDVFDKEQLSNIDLSDAVVIDTVSLIPSQLSVDNEQEKLDWLKCKYQNLFTVLAEKNIRNFIMFSSGGTIYGEGEHPKKETDVVHPSSLYAKSKFLVEKMLQDCSFHHLILRLSNPYGGYQEEQKNQGVIPILIRKILKKEVFTMWVSEMTVRDFIYIDDLAMAIKKLIDLDVHDETINIGSGVGTSLKTIISMLEKQLQEQLMIEKIETNVFNPSKNVLNIEKLQKLTGFQPRVGLEEGMIAEIQRIKESL